MWAILTSAKIITTSSISNLWMRSFAIILRATTIIAIAACIHSPVTNPGPKLTVDSNPDDVGIIGGLVVFELYQIYIRIAIAYTKRKQQFGNEEIG
jgi:hypothetical protein